jgi:sulfite reductase (NADPH) flavoprotein alpha-component
LAFSREQRDKVYEQHLMRKRGAQLWRWLRDGGQLCVCDLTADHRHLYSRAAESTSRR